MTVTLKQAENVNLINTLFQYYLYDMSEYTGWNPNNDGSYAIDTNAIGLNDYWTMPDHHPFYIYTNNELAGFALIRRYPNENNRYDIGQFFVLRRFKRQGVGAAAFNAVLDLFPGPWLTRVLPDNHGANLFWTAVIAKRTNNQFSVSSEHHFDTPMKFIRYDVV